MKKSAYVGLTQCFQTYLNTETFPIKIINVLGQGWGWGWDQGQGKKVY